MKNLSILFLAFFTVAASAVTDEEIQAAAAEYRQNNAEWAIKSDPTPCLKFICDEKYNCSFDGMLKAAQACADNEGRDCIAFICDTKYNCSFDGILKAADACKYNSGRACIAYICDTKFNCSFDGIIKAGLSCGGRELSNAR